MQNPAIKNNGSNRFKFGLRYEDKEVRQLNFNCLTSFVFKQVANCRQNSKIFSFQAKKMIVFPSDYCPFDMVSHIHLIGNNFSAKIITFSTNTYL